MEVSDLKLLSFDKIQNCLEKSILFDRETSEFEAPLFSLFLYFSKVSSKFNFATKVCDSWKIGQLFAVVNTYYIVNYLIFKLPMSLISKVLLVFLCFYVPTDVETPHFLYVSIIQFFTIFCICFFINVYIIIYNKKHLPSFIGFIGYFFIIELPNLFLYPNIILLARAISLLISSKNHSEVFFTLFQFVLTILIFLMSTYANLFKYSYLSNRGQYTNSLIMSSPHIQLIILIFFGFSVFEFETPKQSMLTLSLVTIVVGFIYFLLALSKAFLFHRFNNMNWSLFITLLYVGLSSFYYVKHRDLGGSLFIYISLLVALIGFIIAAIGNVIYDSQIRKTLCEAQTIEDLQIKNLNKYFDYVRIAIDIRHDFIFNGTLLKYGVENIIDHWQRLKLLRYTYFLPLDTPYISNLEKLLFDNSTHGIISDFRLFEYRVLKNWRSIQLLESEREKLQTTTESIHTFYQMASTFSTFISQKKKETSFLFGETLSIFENHIEFHVEQWLLLQPTRIHVLEMMSDFYRIVLLEPKLSHKLKQRVITYSVYQQMIPNFRECLYINHPNSLMNQGTVKQFDRFSQSSDLGNDAPNNSSNMNTPNNNSSSPRRNSSNNSDNINSSANTNSNLNSNVSSSDKMNFTTFTQTLPISNSTDLTSDILYDNKSVIGEFYKSSTKKYIFITFLFLFGFFICTLAFIAMIVRIFDKASNDTSSLLTVLHVFVQNISLIAQLVFYTIYPAINPDLTLDERKETVEYINIYNTNWEQLNFLIEDYFIHRSVLYNTLNNFYFQNIIQTRTITNSPVNISIRAFSTTLSILSSQICPSEDFYLDSSHAFSLFVQIVMNMSSFSRYSSNILSNSIDQTFQQIHDEIFDDVIVLLIFLIVVTVLICLLPFILHIKMSRLKGSSKPEGILDEFKKLHHYIKDKYKTEKRFIVDILLAFLVIFIFGFIILILVIVFIDNYLDYFNDESTNLCVSYYNIGSTFSAVAALQLIDNVDVDKDKLYKDLLILQGELYKGNFSRHHNKIVSSTIFNIILDITKQLGNDGEFNINTTTNANIVNTILDSLIPQITNSNLYEIAESEDYTNAEFIHFLEIFFIFIIVSYFIFAYVCHILYNYVRSIFYAEFIIRMMPFMKSKFGDKINETIQNIDQESNNILDLTGVPSAIIDKDNRIVYVNTIWVSNFRNEQCFFVGKDYHTFISNDIDSELYRSATGLNILMINRTSQLDKTRKETAKATQEYDRIRNSTQPCAVLSAEQLNRNIICLTLSIVPFELQSDDVDLIRDFTNYLLDELNKRVKQCPGAKLFLSSVYDISIFYGLDGGSLKLNALYAMELAAEAIRIVFENTFLDNIFITASLMIGKVGGIFDGNLCRMNRALNSIALSKEVGELLKEFISDTAIELEDHVLLVVLDFIENDSTIDNFEYYQQ